MNKKEKIIQNIKYLFPLVIFIILLVVLYPFVNNLNDKSNQTKKNYKNIDILIQKAENVDSNLDTDSDGLPDRIEIILGTERNISDTDSDGYSDYDELKNGHNPLVASPDDKFNEDFYMIVKDNLFDDGEINLRNLEPIREEMFMQKESSLNKGIIKIATIPEKYEKVSDFIFSSDAKRFLYIVEQDGKSAVVGEKEGKFYDKIDAVVFGNKTNRVAYQAINGKEWYAVIDDKEIGPYDFITKIVFSPNGERTSFQAEKGEKFIVIVDGREDKSYNKNGYNVPELVFSSDGKRIAYRASQVSTKKELVVIDGVKSIHYKGVLNPIFSPDGRRTAYLARSGDNIYVVSDSLKSNNYLLTLSPVFSPNSKRIAFLAIKQNNEWLVVSDWKEEKYYAASIPIFSPDSKKLAYTSIENGQNSIIVNGVKIEKDFSFISLPVFSPDSRRIAYLAKIEGESFVAIDELEGKKYGHVENVVFSPDSKTISYWARVTSTKWLVVVGEKEGKEYDIVSNQVFSSDGKSVVYLAKEGNDIFQVTEAVE